MNRSSYATLHTQQDRGEILLLIGESLDEQRRQAIERAERPQIDMFTINTNVGAGIRDYHWLRSRAKTEPLSRLFVWLASKLGFWHFWLALRVLGSTRNTAVIYATGEDVGIAMAILLRLSGQREPRLIMRLEEPIYGRTALRRAIIRTLVGFGLKRIDLTLPRTGAIVQRLINDFKVSPEKAQLVYDGVDLSFFNPQLPAQPAIVERPKGRYLLSAGLELRDYATLCKAVQDLPIQVLIGAGSPWSRGGFNLKPEEVPANVQISAFNALQMRELYRSAALVVVPVVPTTRACGISVALETLAMARPLIVTATEGLASYFEDGVSAAMVPAGDVAALRARIVALLENTPEAEALAQRGHELVTQHYPLERMIDTLLDLIKAQANAKGSGSF